uniref:hypothetical protein n=1 Tax=Enterobacter cloacae TaxID=550 RepID=UPI001C408EA4|nr:hypothetical protein [Enterobacter cloacae]
MNVEMPFDSTSVGKDSTENADIQPALAGGHIPRSKLYPPVQHDHVASLVLNTNAVLQAFYGLAFVGLSEAEHDI